ncbi:MAG: hypothetical protein U1F61_16065 [Opitutaceae bacterium]
MPDRHSFLFSALMCGSKRAGDATPSRCREPFWRDASLCDDLQRIAPLAPYPADDSAPEEHDLPPTEPTFSVPYGWSPALLRRRRTVESAVFRRSGFAPSQSDLLARLMDHR